MVLHPIDFYNLKPSDIESGFENKVIVRSAVDLANIDSDKEYFLDGIIDMGSNSIEIPAGGIYITGYNFNTSGLISSEDNYTLFTSPVGGSGDILFNDFHIDISGASSQVYDIFSDDGFKAVEINRINFNNCTSLGEIDNYRQGLETGTGRFGGTPELTLTGVWVGGFFIDTSIVRSLTDGSYPLFKAGTGFSMSSRFRTNMNADLNSTVQLLDFTNSNFPNPGTLQLDSCLISRNGVSDSSDTTLTPNVDQLSPASRWKNNVGLYNTYVGGITTLSTETETTISAIDTFVDLEGTFTASNLAHFDSPADGQLRHIGTDPVEFKIVVHFAVDGGANDELELKIVVWDDSASAFVDHKVLLKTVNNFTGGRDVAFFSFEELIVLAENDFVKIQVANTTDTTNVTAELGSELIIEER